MSMKTLHDLMIEDLKDIYHAEKQILKAMPKMIKSVSSDNVRQAFEEHFRQTEKQVTRVEKIFKELNMTPKGKKCLAMEGLIEEGKEIMQEDAEPVVMDAALIAAAQKIEHYEIAAYGTLKTYANQLGLKKVAQIAEEILNEEKMTDEKLTRIAEAEVNVEAAEVH